MLVMVVFFIAFRWIHLSTPLIRLFLLVLILLLIPTLNCLPVWFALSLLRFRLPSRRPMIFFFQVEAGMRDFKVTGVQTCALPIYRTSRYRPAVRRTRFADRHALAGAGHGASREARRRAHHRPVRDRQDDAGSPVPRRGA